MRSTIAEALQEMRLLWDTNAGRLHGQLLRYHPRPLDGIDQMPQPWAQRLTTLITARQTGQVTADTPHYLVHSDGAVVAWATVNAAVVTPDLPLSRNQAKHQRQAAEALGDLARHVLEDLADERDQREGRSRVDTDRGDMLGALRVAPSTDPTNTRWVQIGTDLDAARRAIGDAVGCDPDQALIITALGYGHHGTHTHRLNLAVLCAVNGVAAEHQVPLPTVGDWIDHDAGLAGVADPDTLPELFGEAYLGRFDNRFAYTRHRMREQGWDDLLETTGMSGFFNDRDYTHHLLTSEVLDIHRPDHLPCEPGDDVFRRRPHRPPADEGSRG